MSGQGSGYQSSPMGAGYGGYQSQNMGYPSFGAPSFGSQRPMYSGFQQPGAMNFPGFSWGGYQPQQSFGWGSGFGASPMPSNGYGQPAFAISPEQRSTGDPIRVMPGRMPPVVEV